MPQNIIFAPCVKIKSLKNIFIELNKDLKNTKRNNLYNSKLQRKNKNAIALETISKALSDLKSQDLEMIYFIGSEPFCHYDFNSILRLCLKYSSVTIFTNASSINEKKSRFLKKVEDESQYEIIFRIEFAHYNEKLNDDINGRGSFRESIHALQSLIKYDFIPILNITNYANESDNILIDNFQKTLKNLDINLSCINYAIMPVINKEEEISEDLFLKIAKNPNFLPDCAFSRTLTKDGIFTCPYLTNDHRGRVGKDFSNFAQKNYLETIYCEKCITNNKTIWMN